MPRHGDWCVHPIYSQWIDPNPKSRFEMITHMFDHFLRANVKNNDSLVKYKLTPFDFWAFEILRCLFLNIWIYDNILLFYLFIK